VFDRTFRITGVLRQLALLVAVIGVFSALMAIQLERRREFAVLRALGTTRAQLGLLVVLESALLGLFAGLLALPTGAVMAWVLTDAVQLRAFGWSMPFQVPPLPLLLTLVSGLGAAVVAGLYPAWRAGWRDPAPMLRDD
jgi:putative ABC transport system permease protein